MKGIIAYLKNAISYWKTVYREIKGLTQLYITIPRLYFTLHLDHYDKLERDHLMENVYEIWKQDMSRDIKDIFLETHKALYGKK